MINDHPDLDGRFMRWCEHLNVVEADHIGVDFGLVTNTTNFIKILICEDCGDSIVKGDSEKWLPKLIGTRVDDTRNHSDS